MKKILIGIALALLSCVAWSQPTAQAPDQLVRAITDEVIGIIKKDKEIQAGNAKRIQEVVEVRVLPHFNFTRMTQIALAVNWRKATPEQQKALVDEFKTLLVRTYSTALSLYRDQSIDFRPMRSKPEDTEVTVRSEIKQSGRQPVSLDYEMEKSAAGWKVYDVKVGGVSLISTYRDDFAGQVRDSGIDGLIKTLSAKNRQAPSGGTKS